MSEPLAVPTYDRFIEPLLRLLGSRPTGVAIGEAYEAVADALGLSDLQRAVTVASGQPTYKNRCGWAQDRLKRAGFASSPRRGVWQITERGAAFLAGNRTAMSDDVIESIARDYIDVRLRAPIESTASAHSAAPAPGPAATSPDDRLGSALAEISSSVAGDLLDLLGQVSPRYFESIVLDLLHRMGYGASRADLHHVGGVGDGGIDGVIALDRLGLEKVYVQAKRWKDSVGGPQVQAFFGALAGKRASKGVIITTSNFTPAATAFAESVGKIVLVDGERLATLMIDHEVGVSCRALRVPRIDSDYFDE